MATDTSRSFALTVEIAAQLGGVAHRARLEANGAETQPPPWSLEGCDLSYDARELISKQYARLERLVRRDEILVELESRVTL